MYTVYCKHVYCIVYSVYCIMCNTAMCYVALETKKQCNSTMLL